MQSLAAEMRHSETAFVVPKGGSFGLRWFTPLEEVPRAARATLGSAHVSWERGVAPAPSPTPSAPLSGRSTGTLGPDGVSMDFPTDPPVDGAAPAGLFAALGCKPTPVFAGK